MILFILTILIFIILFFLVPTPKEWEQIKINKYYNKISQGETYDWYGRGGFSDNTIIIIIEEEWKGL